MKRILQNSTLLPMSTRKSNSEGVAQLEGYAYIELTDFLHRVLLLLTFHQLEPILAPEIKSSQMGLDTRFPGRTSVLN